MSLKLYQDSTLSLPISPFTRLRYLLADIPSGKPEISFIVGNPRPSPPQFVLENLTSDFNCFGVYPPITGIDEWQISVRKMLQRRFGLATDSFLASPHQILPVNGTREGLFLVSQIARPLIKTKNLIGLPNPLYPVYASSTLATGAIPLYLNATKESGFLPDLHHLSTVELEAMRAIFICSPTNPQGVIVDALYLNTLLDMAQKYDFLVIMDECYIDIYDKSLENNPPISALNVAEKRVEGADNLIVFHSLSKRSSLPGLRSGFCAGGKKIMEDYLKLRMIVGSQTPIAIQKAACLAWEDEAHVADNRRYYQNKIDIASNILEGYFDFYRPLGGFFLWLQVGHGEKVALKLWKECGIKILPGAYLGETVNGINPGDAFIRLAFGHVEERPFISALKQMRKILPKEGYICNDTV